MSFRPYSEETHVVGDTARFHHESGLPRNRSRNTSPLAMDGSPMGYIATNNAYTSVSNPATVKRKLTLNYEPTNQQLNYEKQRQYRPVPPTKSYNHQSYNEHTKSISQPTPYNTNHVYENPLIPKNGDDLPPEMDPATYQARKASGVSQVSQYAPPPLPYQKQMEHDLVQRVMNPPTWTISRKHEVDQDVWEEINYTISAFSLLHIFESICGIVLITLSSILIDRDTTVNGSYYKYLLSDLIITLAISFLFLSKTVNYESRNGVLYCMIALVMKIISFIMVTVIIIPNSDCHISKACPMRRALTAFIIICTFLWLINCVIFFTTLYISRSNILTDMAFQPVNSEKVNDLPAQPTPGANATDCIDPRSGEPLKEYILDSQGEMHEVTTETDLKDRRKVIVYF